MYYSLCHTTCSDWINAPGSVCWVQSSLVYSVWHGLLQGLIWAIDHMDPGSDRYHLSFARHGSLACFCLQVISLAGFQGPITTILAGEAYMPSWTIIVHQSHHL